MKTKQILKLPMGEYADAGPTVADYLSETFKALIHEGESFSGKRPLGNSDWDWQLAAALVKGRAIRGLLDECGDIEECDWDDFSKVMNRVIEDVFSG